MFSSGPLLDMNLCRSTLVYPKLRSCFSSQSIASRLRCVPCIRSPNCVSPLMCVLYRSRSSRPTTVRTGTEGAFVVWAETTVARTNVPRKNRIVVSYCCKETRAKARVRTLLIRENVDCAGPQRRVVILISVDAFGGAGFDAGADGHELAVL